MQTTENNLRVFFFPKVQLQSTQRKCNFFKKIVNFCIFFGGETVFKLTTAKTPLIKSKSGANIDVASVMRFAKAWKNCADFFHFFQDGDLPVHWIYPTHLIMPYEPKNASKVRLARKAIEIKINLEHSILSRNNRLQMCNRLFWDG
jgi:hypothetical protein